MSVTTVHERVKFDWREKIVPYLDHRDMLTNSVNGKSRWYDQNVWHDRENLRPFCNTLLYHNI